jgi:hypothetical protein
MAFEKKQKESKIYQIKVTLKYSRPPIWRRIQVAGETTFHELHDILQRVMGWDDSHLHEFIIGDRTYGGSDYEAGSAPKRRASGNLALVEVVHREKSKFIYEYDFGDSWQHVLLVEKILPPEEGVRYPRCLAGRGACPPEDCGGMYGYYTKLEALRDAEHPEHEEIIDWMGEDFDPDAFDLEDINARLEWLSEHLLGDGNL